MLNKLEDLILNNMEVGQISAVVLMDLSATFDIVNHTILLATFEKIYGIMEEALSWIKSFVSGRSYHVTVNTKLSKEKQLYLSVPQGGYSSGFFFIMYVATLFHVIPEKITLFGLANNHALQGCFSAISRSEEAETIYSLEKTPIYVQNYIMNSDKTGLIYLGSRQHLQKCSSNITEGCGDNNQEIRKCVIPRHTYEIPILRQISKLPRACQKNVLHCHGKIREISFL